MNRMAPIIEAILFRRGLEHKLDGYTLETSIEIAESLAEKTRLFGMNEVELANIEAERQDAALSVESGEGTPQPETAWLIERGGLCLGFCEHKFAWGTFTNEDALRFARQRDGYSFMECCKWTPFDLHLEDAKVTEHQWGSGREPILNG